MLQAFAISMLRASHHIFRSTFSEPDYNSTIVFYVTVVHHSRIHSSAPCDLSLVQVTSLQVFMMYEPATLLINCVHKLAAPDTFLFRRSLNEGCS